MDENTQAEPEQQEAPMPSAEPSEVPQEPQEDGLPESASDRTRHEFEKLREENRRERERREAAEAAFRTLQPNQVAQPEPIYDPDTGYVDPNALTALQRQAVEANERATKAEQTVNQFRQEQEAREAYLAHPEANPDSKEYNPKLKNLAAGVILQSMLNPQEFGGKQFSLKEAYDYLKADTTDTKAVEEARKEGAQEAIEQLTPKEQATLEAIGTSGRRSDVGQSHDTLVERTRRGDYDAIAERMKRISGQE